MGHRQGQVRAFQDAFQILVEAAVEIEPAAVRPRKRKADGLGELRPQGYLLLKRRPLEDGTAYLYDLNVCAAGRGQEGARRLMHCAEDFLWRKGFTRVAADVSCSNQSALQAALQAGGFRKDWERWGRRAA